MQPSSSSNASRTRNLVLCGIISVFALLGILIAYNSGATAEEQQALAIKSRVDSVRRRLKSCTDEVSAIDKGETISFERRTQSLHERLAALREENKMYDEQNERARTDRTDCLDRLGAARKRRTGTSDEDAPERIRELRFQLKSVKAAIDATNATRMENRRQLLRILEAYSKENAALAKLYRQRLVDAASTVAPSANSNETSRR